jgi:hypothetical protein
MDAEHPDVAWIAVPSLVGMTVSEARSAGHHSGVVVTSEHVDGPPLGALTWPGTWTVTAQRPIPGSHVERWSTVVIEFKERPGGGGAGDREPRVPLPEPPMMTAERDQTDEPDEPGENMHQVR